MAEQQHEDEDDGEYSADDEAETPRPDADTSDDEPVVVVPAADEDDEIWASEYWPDDFDEPSFEEEPAIEDELSVADAMPVPVNLYAALARGTLN